MCFLSVDFRLQMLMERSLLAIVSLMAFQIFEALYINCELGSGVIRKDFFDGTYDEKYPWGGWCKTQISRSTQGSFLCLGGGVGCQTEISKSTRGAQLFLRQMTIISLEINGKCIYLCIIWPNRLQLLL